MRKVVQVIRQSHDPDKHVANSETLIYNVDIATLSEPLQGLFTNQDFPEYDIHTDWFEQYHDAKDYGTCDILNNMKSTSEDQELEGRRVRRHLLAVQAGHGAHHALDPLLLQL